MYAFGVAGERLTLRLRSQAFAATLRQEVAYFDSEANSVGALCARLSQDAANVQGVSIIDVDISIKRFFFKENVTICAT
jgi:ABC-type multidrug transport system fused ATPase/permease subunit